MSIRPISGSRVADDSSFRRSLGARVRKWSAAGRTLGTLAVAILLTSCNYSFRAGSFPPEHIQTMAVLPFENETDRFELTQEVHQALSRDLPRALGVQTGSEQNADAVVRGTIRRYDLTAPLYRTGADQTRTDVLQREVNISVQVEIVDVVENVILWENGSIMARGQYLDASETEEVGRNEAIEILVQSIIDGAQSNW
jgi:hypothetical protein